MGRHPNTSSINQWQLLWPTLPVHRHCNVFGIHLADKKSKILVAIYLHNLSVIKPHPLHQSCTRADICNRGPPHGPQFNATRPASRNFKTTQLAARHGPQKARINILGPKISVFNCHLESLIRESFHGTEFLSIDVSEL